MSSREIAELTGKAHNHVKRDIVKMLEGLEEDVTKFGYMSTDSYGRPQHVFALPKRETLILVSGYNVQMRARIIDRRQELEQRVVAPPQLTREQQWTDY
ncbi:Rha family transcriptional regulator [Burkholderia orbicola]|uniref:Rha family transcriptional regulator n=1 Tax=Burkholderia orbicola TaxID=2978683 RepID=UPI002650CABF|nr:Rha family transcriptional regulator [Burkholderia orbicola]MDN7994548.1 Rha family transcriptional regulator [Burkholderia orbicola]